MSGEKSVASNKYAACSKNLLWENKYRRKKRGRLPSSCNKWRRCGRASKYVGKGSSIFISLTRPIRVSRIQGVSSTRSFSLSLFFSFSLFLFSSFSLFMYVVWDYVYPTKAIRATRICLRNVHIARMRAYLFPLHKLHSISTLSYRVTVFISLCASWRTYIRMSPSTSTLIKSQNKQRQILWNISCAIYLNLKYFTLSHRSS